MLSGRLVLKLPMVIGVAAPICSAGAEPKVVRAPVPSTLSTIPSPSASVVVSVATVVEGGAAMKMPPSTLPPIWIAEPPCWTSAGVAWILSRMVVVVSRTATA